MEQSSFSLTHPHISFIQYNEHFECPYVLGTQMCIEQSAILPSFNMYGFRSPNIYWAPSVCQTLGRQMNEPRA